MKNIEIKTPLASRALVEERLESLGAELVWSRQQRDTFYGVARGWLKLREAEGQAAELISYQRATDDTGPRASVYHREPLDDGERWHALLGHVLEREAVVAKQRTLWLWRRTRIHLDQVEGLGEYLELETVLDGVDEAAGRAESEQLIDALGLERERFVGLPYKVLLESV